MLDSRIFGVDFTSAPSRSKSITVAHARLRGSRLVFSAIERLQSFVAFEAFLNRPEPWIAGFDFPFGLPRELVEVLRWPPDWRSLILHLREIGKEQFKADLNRIRELRPMGARYIERAGDRLAGSSSPMKLVNPPVGLMFFEGAPRLLDSGVCIIPCHPNEGERVALEAYPGYLARKLAKQSYKKDGKEGLSPLRTAARREILLRLPEYCLDQFEMDLTLNAELSAECVGDGSGDSLDAVLCAIQAAVSANAYAAGDLRYGIPCNADPLEGWIATV